MPLFVNLRLFNILSFFLERLGFGFLMEKMHENMRQWPWHRKSFFNYSFNKYFVQNSLFFVYWIDPASPSQEAKPLGDARSPLLTGTEDTGRASFPCYNAVKCAKCCENIGWGQGRGRNNPAHHVSPLTQGRTLNCLLLLYGSFFPPIKRVIFVYRDPGQFSI